MPRSQSSWQFAWRNRWVTAWQPLWPRPLKTWDAVLALYPDAVDEQRRRRFAELQQQYTVASWLGLLEAQDMRESLYVLDLFDRYIKPHTSDQVGTALDVGSKNGCYLSGLIAAHYTVDGIELDAHRRYADFSTRRTYAERILQKHNQALTDLAVSGGRSILGDRSISGDLAASGASANASGFPISRFPISRFLCGSVENHPELRSDYRLITWFLPFLTPAPLRAWGLPDQYFSPASLFTSVLSRLADDGVLYVVNQGESEYQIQKQIIDDKTDSSITVIDFGQISSIFSPFTKPRFAFLLKKQKPTKI